MEYILTGHEMAEADSRTSGIIGIPSIVLMERAALAVASEITSRVHSSARVCILAGPGNNGADGLAAGRILMDAGYTVQILLLSDLEPAEGSPPWIQRRILESYPECCGGGPELFSADKMREFAPDVIVDGLFGTGLGRPISGKAGEIVRAVNDYRSRKESCLVVGLDMPSGVCSDDGSILGCAPKCDLTVTFAFYKRGHLMFPGAEYCGRVILKQIGITARAFAGSSLSPSMYRLDWRDVQRRLGARDESGNKGTFGKVLLIAGSKGMCGAAIMGAEACMRSGAGMVKLFTREENRVIVQQRLPEAMLTTYGENCTDGQAPEDDYSGLRGRLLSDLKWADIAAVGPGIGQSAEAAEAVRVLLEAVQTDEYVKGIVLDADALRILAKREDLRKLLASRSPRVSCILTPHLAEFADLLHISVKEAAADRESRLRELAAELHCTVTCKDARTMVGSGGRMTCLITNGNSGMATAGSGDVLTGITAAVLAQICMKTVRRGADHRGAVPCPVCPRKTDSVRTGADHPGDAPAASAGKETEEAAAASDKAACRSLSAQISQIAAETAAWIHAQAGDAAKSAEGERSMVAGDLIRSLKKVMHSLE